MGKLNELLSKIITKVNASVKTEAQSLSDTEKAQARENIGVLQPTYAEANEAITVKSVDENGTATAYDSVEMAGWRKYVKVEFDGNIADKHSVQIEENSIAVHVSDIPIEINSDNLKSLWFESTDGSDPIEYVTSGFPWKVDEEMFGNGTSVVIFVGVPVAISVPNTMNIEGIEFKKGVYVLYRTNAEGEAVGWISLLETETIQHIDPAYIPEALTDEEKAKVREKIGAMAADVEIPSIDGLASETYVNDAVDGLVNEAYVSDAVKDLASETYVDNKIAAIPTPDVSGQIETHNTASDAHGDIRQSIDQLGEDIGVLVESDRYYIVNVSSDDGVNYTGTIEGLTAIKPGQIIIMIPNKASTSRHSITLNINGLGAKSVYRKSSDGFIYYGVKNDWLSIGTAYILLYTSTYWEAINLPKPLASDLSGSVPITLGGHGGATAEEARANLGITPENIGAATADHAHTIDLTEEQLSELSALLEVV